MLSRSTLGARDMLNETTGTNVRETINVLDMEEQVRLPNQSTQQSMMARRETSKNASRSARPGSHAERSLSAVEKLECTLQEQQRVKQDYYQLM